jgi:hypothetical protein
MPTAARPVLSPGTVYRTDAFRKYGKNPTRLAVRLVHEGRLEKLRNGLYYAPRMSRFGAVPPSDVELLKGFFGKHPFLVTGSSVWNSLGLGSTAVATTQLVYNRQRTESLEVAGRHFDLRRVRFPQRGVDLEYYVVDLLENAELAVVESGVLAENLTRAVGSGRFDGSRLLATAVQFGSQRTQRAVAQAIAA